MFACRLFLKNMPRVKMVLEIDTKENCELNQTACVFQGHGELKQWNDYFISHLKYYFDI